MSRPGRQRGSRWLARVVLVLISTISAAAALVVSASFRQWESASADLRMRWRYAMTPEAERASRVHPDIHLLDIDFNTLSKIGRFGGGAWMSRRPFVDQLSFFEDFLSPSVMAFDIVIQDPLGEWARLQEDVTESSETLEHIATQLKRVAEESGETMDVWVLDRLNRFSMEQGNVILVDKLAAIQEEERFDVLLAYYFMGGWVDPQRGLRSWSDSDVFGEDESGDEDFGEVIYYLKEMAIPKADIHQNAGGGLYDYSRNGVLPALELRDYGWLGYVNCPRDDDTIVRRIPMVLGFKYGNRVTGKHEQLFVPGFALAACLLHLGFDFPLDEGDVKVILGEEIRIHAADRTYRIPIDEKGRMYLNFRTRLQDIPKTSFVNTALPSYAVSREFREERAGELQAVMNGRLVFVGVTTTAVDVGAYPLSLDKPTPLVHIHLTAADNILSQQFLAPVSRRGNVLLWCCLLLCFTWLCFRERSARLAPTTLLCIVLYVLVAYLGVHLGWGILPMVSPSVYMLTCSFGVMTYRFFTESRAKRKIRGMFSTMVSDKVLTFLEESPDSFSLTGHSAEVTVFFSDIAAFTAIGERLPPQELTELLNAYFTPVSNCILEMGGYLDKYVGDEVMAVWGAPYPVAEHAVKACLSALEQQKIIDDMNPGLRDRYGCELRVRMGINSGVAIAGNMGSARKLQYTVMGDVVNLASRLEPVNKDFGTRIIIGDATFQQARAKICARRLASIVVVGKKEIVPIYELIGEAGRTDDKLLEMAAVYESALDRFQARDWAGCLQGLERLDGLGHDPASQQLRERAREAQEHPPADDWQGEYVRQSKA